MAFVPLSGQAGEAPKVVASLKPIHALAAAIMDGVGTPQLIVQGAASEHLYAMRPSQAQALEAADAIIWVGPVMEHYLIRPIASLPKHARVVTLIDLPGLTRFALRKGGPFEPDEHETHDGSSGASAGFDGHVWLDPANARVIGDALAETLAALDPGHAQIYAANAARLRADLTALDAELKTRLEPLRGRPFIVFHDAYHALEARYALTVVGSITVDPSLSASAQRVAALRARIKSLGAVCVFSEPQFEPKLVRSLIEGTGARTGVLDPLGASLQPGRAAYFTLLRDIAGALEGCLKP